MFSRALIEFSASFIYPGVTNCSASLRFAECIRSKNAGVNNDSIIISKFLSSEMFDSLVMVNDPTKLDNISSMRVMVAVPLLYIFMVKS